MNLKELLFDETNQTRTENDAKAYATTKSAILDLFSIGGACRNLTHEQVYQKISQALAEDKELGLRCLLFLADIRKGQGERRLFKVGIEVIMDTQKELLVQRVLEYVPHFGRWDYLVDHIEHPRYGKFILDIIKKEWLKDEPSLFYKWLPKPHTHGVKKPHAKIIYSYLGINEKQYRKKLSHMRGKINLVEKDMSDKQWGKIEYSHVPSKASMIYKNAFNRHDEKRYKEFLTSVEKGESKINASVLYPHELVQKAYYENDKTIDVLWNALPNYVKDDGKMILPMVDVSGSMESRISYESGVMAIHVAIGMGLYLSEKLTGLFKDTFLTFSSHPQIIKVSGDTLYQKIINMSRADWGMSTNITNAFKLLIDVAIKNRIPKNEMPQSIVVFSDMEFDSATSRYETPFEEIKKHYNFNGYEMPSITFWNINARNVQFPVKQDENGVTLVSGYSPTTLQYILSGELKTPYELMIEVIMSERYDIFN